MNQIKQFFLERESPTLSWYCYHRKINNAYQRKICLAIIHIIRTRLWQLAYIFYKLIQEVINIVKLLEKNDRKTRSCRRFTRNRGWWALLFRYHIKFFCFSFFLNFFQVYSSLCSLFMFSFPKADLGLLQHPRWSALW